MESPYYALRISGRSKELILKISFQKIAIACLATNVLLISGCITQTKRSALSLGASQFDVNGRQIQTLGTIFVWDSDVSAAVIDGKGRTCIQRALTTQDVKASGALSDAILKWTKILETTADQKERELLSVAIAQTSTMLTTTTERTAFLDTGLFYICQLVANETLTMNDVSRLTQEVIKSAAGLNTNKVVVGIDTSNAPPYIIEPTQPIVPSQPVVPKE